MPTRPVPPVLSLSLFLCLMSFALVAAILFAALVPIVDCPDGCLDRELPRACSYCNGWGKSPALQRWYYMHYEWQREKYEVVICGTGMPREQSLWERALHRVAALFDGP
jgi:hypothetical protein